MILLAYSKICTRCRKLKDSLQFGNATRSKDGKKHKCKSCANALYIHANPQRNRRIPAPPIEIKKQLQKDYKRRYWLLHKVELQAERTRAANIRYKNDPIFRLTSNLRTRINHAIRGDCKAGSAVNDLGCSINEFRSYIESQFYTNSEGKAMTWDTWGANAGHWQVDHIEPICSFDLTDRNQFVRACNYTNMRPLWHEDHVAKLASDLKRKVV